jgi:outer membrane protein
MPRFLIAAAVMSALATGRAESQRPDTLRLTLAQAITMAAQESDEVRLGVAQGDLADAQLTAARASALPQLRLNSGYSHAFENARAQAVGQVFNQPDSYSATLVLSQPLFQGGRIWAAIRAAGDVRQAVRLDAVEVRARVAVDVQRAYLQALYTGVVADLQARNLELANARLRQVEQLEAAGRAARYDVLRARVASANIEPLLIQARNDRDLALLEVKRIVNVPFDQPVALLTGIDSVAVAALLASLPPVETVPDRPALRAAELALSARRQGVTIARAERLPTINVSFQNGYQAFPPPGFGLPDRRGQAASEFCAPGAPPTLRCQNGGWFTDRSVAAQLSVPLFDGLRARGNTEVARAQVRLAELQLRQQREQVALEVSRARAELSRARATFDARRQNAAEAVEAFQLAELRFSRGLSTQVEVADAQLAMLTAQSGQARATFDLYLAAVEFTRAIGRPVDPATVAGSAPISR